MKICILGLSHKTAPVEIREKIAFSSPQKLEEGLLLLKKIPHIKEVVILSTCNRVEIYLIVSDGINWKEDIISFFCSYQGLKRDDFVSHLYFKEDTDAVKHIFRVACGLDSMVLGEPQITGQLKEAYGISAGKNTTGFYINKLMHNAFSVAKRVRTETKIGSFAVSISFAAVELAKKIFETLEGKKAMLIGAGEMAELAAKHLITNGVSQIIVANRTYERACMLASDFNGVPCNFEEFPDKLKDVDIVISSTGAPNFIITPEKIKDAIKARRNKPMFLIDIAVPRDIDPKVNELDNCYLYDIDDLQNVVDENLKERQKEALKAEEIINSEVYEFERWLRSLEVKPLIVEIRRYFERIKEEELEEAKKKLSHLTEKDIKTIEAMLNAIVNKTLHRPTVFLKNLSNGEENYLYLDAIKEIFGIGREEKDEKKD
ncbi:MAG: glutamyl-tRNA reductase [Proteobacteria bacterium]|nr:glutamyl-tRNA reductase [Pseudomonadota bacterium]